MCFSDALCVLACGHFRPEHVSRSFGPEERRPQRSPRVRGRTKSMSRAFADLREDDTVSWRDEYRMPQEIEGAVPSGLWCVPSRRGPPSVCGPNICLSRINWPGHRPSSLGQGSARAMHQLATASPTLPTVALPPQHLRQRCESPSGKEFGGKVASKDGSLVRT